MVRRMSTKDKIVANRSAIVLLIIALVFVVVAARYGGLWSEYVGGTNWQIDLQWTSADIAWELTDDVVYTWDNLPEIAHTYTYWEMDPDGEIQYTAGEGGEHSGGHAGMKLQVSGFQRINQAGMELGYQDVDPFQVSHNIDTDGDGEADKVQYEFYYRFAVGVRSVQTSAQMGAVTICEFGGAHVSSVLTVILEKGVFVGDASEALVMDCTVKDIDVQEMEDYIYKVTPNADEGQDIGAQIDVMNQRTIDLGDGTKQTLFDLQFECEIKPGVTTDSLISANMFPYEVHVEKVCWLTVMYDQPLDVGAIPPGDLDMPDAPAPPNPLEDFLNALPLIGLFAFILIITLIIGAVLVMYYWQKRSQSNVYVSSGY